MNLLSDGRSEAIVTIVTRVSRGIGKVKVGFSGYNINADCRAATGALNELTQGGKR